MLTQNDTQARIKARSSARKRARAEAAMAAEALAEASRAQGKNGSKDETSTRQKMLLGSHMTHIQVSLLLAERITESQALWF